MTHRDRGFVRRRPFLTGAGSALFAPVLAQAAAARNAFDPTRDEVTKLNVLLRNGRSWGPRAAAIFIVTAPMLLLAGTLMRVMVSSLMAGSIKG